MSRLIFILEVTMDYITAQEAADKWNITRRRVQILCTGDRIDGAIKIANLWLIPKDAEKPSDKRKNRKTSKKTYDVN
jgi:hypothetical protein